MAFFGDQENSKLAPSDQDREMAKKLHDSVFCRYKNRARWNQTAWAGEFRILRKELSNDIDRIEFVLTWVCDELEGKGTITISSAKGFRKGFLWIEQKALKSGPRSDPDKLPKEKLDAFLAYMKEQESYYVWPKELQPQIKDFLTASFANYHDYTERLKELHSQRCNHQKVMWLVEYVKESLSSPEFFLAAWARKVWELVHTWEEFNGNLTPFVFKVRHNWFMNRMIANARKFGSKPEEWFEILKLLGYGHAV